MTKYNPDVLFDQYTATTSWVFLFVQFEGEENEIFYCIPRFQSIQSIQFITLTPYATRDYSSFLYLQINSAFISQPTLYAAPCSRLPSTLQTRKPTKGPLYPASHCTANTVSLANDIGHGAVVVVLARAHQSLIVLRIHVHLCDKVCLLSWARSMALAATRTSLCLFSFDHTRSRNHNTSCQS